MDQREWIHKLVDAAFDKGPRDVHVSQGKQILVEGDKLVTGPGWQLIVRIESPYEKVDYDTVTVERLVRSTWEKCAWMDMRIGDVVRFRNPDGTLQRDHGWTDPETGVRWAEVRDWTVVGPPTPRHELTPSGVKVEVHDGDRAEARVG